MVGIRAIVALIYHVLLKNRVGDPTTFGRGHGVAGGLSEMVEKLGGDSYPTPFSPSTCITMGYSITPKPPSPSRGALKRLVHDHRRDFCRTHSAGLHITARNDGRQKAFGLMVGGIKSGSHLRNSFRHNIDRTSITPLPRTSRHTADAQVQAHHPIQQPTSI